jgi:hypothetical protein
VVGGGSTAAMAIDAATRRVHCLLWKTKGPPMISEFPSRGFQHKQSHLHTASLVLGLPLEAVLGPNKLWEGN